MPGVGGPVRLQPLVRARVEALGDEGRAWVAALPGVLDDLCGTWSLRLGRRLPGGSSSYLTTVVQADGSEAVLKVALPGTGSAGHAAALRSAAGRGYVVVLEDRPELEALLLERLGRPLAQVGLGPEAQLDALAATLLRAWRAPDRPAVDRAGSLAARIRDFHAQAPGAVGTDVVEHALAYAAQLADPADLAPADLVLAHGDPHPGNLLQVRHPRPGAETGWCFVDPDPFVADRAYDLGVAVRDFSATLLAEPGTAAARLRTWCRRVAVPSGADPGRVWAWGFLERVSTGLYVSSFGAPRVGAPLLRSAEVLLGQGRPASARNC